MWSNTVGASAASSSSANGEGGPFLALGMVVAPFAAAYNKKHGNPLDPKPLDATKLSSIAVDDAPVELADAAKPTCMVLPIGCKRIDLAFGDQVRVYCLYLASNLLDFHQFLS